MKPNECNRLYLSEEHELKKCATLTTHYLRKRALQSLLGLLVFVGTFSIPGVAVAHDPLFLENKHNEPQLGPFLPDARISFALYGTLLEPQQQRAFQFQIPSGEQINLSLLIPDLPPENLITQEFLPVLSLTRPDQTILQLKANLSEPFAEPFSGTNYVRLLDHREIANDGTYQVRVFGSTPSRFTVSIGFIEAFGTPVGNFNRGDKSMGALADWYATPPPQDNTATTTAESTTSAPTKPTTPDDALPELGVPSSADLRDQNPHPLLVAGGLVALVGIALLPLIRFRRSDN